MKNKKTNSYKPYDISNSFVRRVTSRVSQLLPQPTSWLNRLLSREPEQAGPSDSQETEEDEISMQPPSKRMRTVQTGTDFTIYRNNIASSNTQRLEGEREEELSPIRSYKLPSTVNTLVSNSSASRNQSSGAGVAGPSGVIRSQIHNAFAASTPATIASKEPVSDVDHQSGVQPKLNGDDGSSSDSSSQVSSMQCDNVVRTQRQCDRRHSSLYTDRSLNRNRVWLIQREDSSNLVRSKQLKLDMSNSSLSSSRGGRVSFDSTVFNSPFKGRLCGGYSLNQSDSSFTESPFYKSNTTFGGNSSCNESMLRTRSLHSEIPVVIQPTLPKTDIDNLGTSTKKILKALEQFSTPMLDRSRSIEYSRDRGLKRKVEVPYKELVIPQMPDLLRIKRREARTNCHRVRVTSKSVGTPSPLPSSPSVSSSSETVPSSMPQFQLVSSMNSAQYLPSKSSSSQLCSRSLKPEENVLSKVKTVESSLSSKNKTNEDVNLWSVGVTTGLPLVNSSLPKFDSCLVKNTPSTPSNVWSFSKPICVSNEELCCTSIPPSKKFSRPLDTENKEDDVNNITLTNSVNNSGSQTSEIMTYIPPSAPRLKRKEFDPISSQKSVVSTSSELESGDVSDVLNKQANVLEAVKPESVSKSLKWECKECYVMNNNENNKCVACQQPRNTAPSSSVVTDMKESTTSNFSGFGDKFKMNSNKWECSTCLVRNKIEEKKCVACGQDNIGNNNSSNEIKTKKLTVNSGFGDKFKLATGSWECSVCLVQNKPDTLKCVSCTSDKPGHKKVETNDVEPLSNLIKKPEGSWECDTCLVRNKVEATRCVSCSTTKPATASNTSTFSFGIPGKDKDRPSETAPKITFGVTCSSSSASFNPPSFSFGSTNVPSTQASAVPKFSFGIPSSAIDSKPANNSDEKKVESNKKSSDLDVKSQTSTFSFGVSDKKSIFGNVSTSSGNVVASTTTTSVINESSSCSPANLPIFVHQISSTKSPSTSSQKLSSPVSNPIFSSSNINDKNPVNLFQNPKSSETMSPVFGRQNDTGTLVTDKADVSNSISSSDKSTAQPKSNLFSFGSANSTSNKHFFNSTPAPETAGFNFGSTTNSFINPSTAGTAQSRPTFTSFTGFSSVSDQQKNTFGSQVAQDTNSFKNPEQPIFSFAAKSETCSATPFQFGSAVTNHTNSFGSVTPTNTDQFNSNSFGSNPGASTGLFSNQPSIFGTTTPQPAQTASFLFGASQTNDRPPPAPTFNFTSQSGSNVNAQVVAGGFTFGQSQSVQNSGALTGTSVQPPSFDPNKKPVFNFSAGQTPTFSAQATAGSLTSERKIRKAVRRTTQK